MRKRITLVAIAFVLVAYFLAGCSSKPAASTGENVKIGNYIDVNSISEDSLLKKIMKEGKITLGTEGTYAPVSYHDEDGALVGSDVEVARKIAEKMGVTAEFVESDWDSLIAALDSGRIDTMVNSVSITEERRKKYDFTDPYFAIKRIVVTLDGSPISSPEDLSGLTIATNLTNAFIPTLEEYGVTVLPIDTFEQSVEMLKTNRADFLMPNEMVFWPYMKSHPDAGVSMAFVWEGAEADAFGIPVPKGDADFLTVLDKILDELLEEGVLTEISQRYYATDFSVVG